MPKKNSRTTASSALDIDDLSDRYRAKRAEAAFPANADSPCRDRHAAPGHDCGLRGAVPGARGSVLLRCVRLVSNFVGSIRLFHLLIEIT